MARLIDADELLKLYDMGGELEEYAAVLTVPIPVIRQNIKDMPTVDAKPVVHGRWEAFKNTAVRCSECKLILSDICGECFSYCPNCGADMREGE